MRNFIYISTVCVLLIIAFFIGFYINKIINRSSTNQELKQSSNNPFSLDLPIPSNNSSVSALTLSYSVHGSITAISGNDQKKEVELTDTNGKTIGNYSIKSDAVVIQMEDKAVNRKDITILQRGQEIQNANIFYRVENGKITSSYISYILVK